MNKKIGKLNYKVIKLLGLDYKEEIPIYIGDANIEHMQRQHPEDYKKYRNKNRRDNKETYICC